jgi:hypothetical protein
VECLGSDAELVETKRQELCLCVEQQGGDGEAEEHVEGVESAVAVQVSSGQEAPGWRVFSDCSHLD